MRSDVEKEYSSGQFNCYLQQMGIRRKFNYRDKQEKNGMAERNNWSVVEAPLAMLEEINHPQVLLGRSCSNRGLHPKLDHKNSVGT